MRWALGIIIIALAASSADAAPPTRAEFAAKLAQVKPGMTGAQVKQLLGAPSDIKTEADPGGISAARTVEIWRYGTRAHLAFPTLGSVHIQADGKVQYVFGDKGTPYTGMPEAELRNLLELVDAVPSYNQVLDPLPLIRAVNALQPLGKDRALAVVDEYLRVSSFIDHPGREGVFLLMRTLFDVPASGMPPMRVGGALEPKDPKALPRFPLVIVDDVPFKLVGGYVLGGEAEPPEHDVAAFRKAGTLRAKPLAPSVKVLDTLETFVSGPLAAAFPVDDNLRVMLYDQALRFADTVYRPADRTVDAWFPSGFDVAARWKQRRADVAKLGATWNAKTQRLELPGGKTLPPIVTGFKRVWWDLAAKSRVTLERLSDDVIHIQVRHEGHAAADAVNVLDAKTGTKLATLSWTVIAPNSTNISSQRLQLARGQAIRLVLASGKSGPTLTP